MMYSFLLDCAKFKNDFLNFCYDETLCMQEFDESDFEFFDEDLFNKLLEFFKKEFNVKITTIHNYPLSYIVNFESKSYEFFDDFTMFIEIIEKLYGYEYE